MHRFFVFSILSAILFLSCTTLSPAQPPAKINADTAALVKGDNAFAFNLYGKLASKDGNLFFSPYSISNALAMTYAGARGKTATEMAATLQFPFDENRLHTAFNDLINEINQPGKKRKYQLSVANRLWGQKDYGFLPDFVQLSKGAYGAGMQELDFANTDAARKTINDWVAKETQDKIKDLLPEGSLASDTRLVLTNAIYFKANWAEAFNAKATKKEDFKNAGKTVKVDMMHQTEMLNLFADDSLQMLEIPYDQRELSMLVVLPRKADGLAEIEKQLTADNLQAWTAKMKRFQVAVSLPKFKYTSEFKLKEALSQLGMGLAFSKNADFSGMASREKLFIDAVIHKAFVAVDEKGTEAAAATAVTIRPTSAPAGQPTTFRADHPFVFLIRDNRTGSVLFVGRVVNP